MRYFIIAGEASGDMHGAALIRQIKAVDNQAQFLFLGGDLMSKAADSTPLIHIKNMAFMGFVNVVLNISKIKNIIKLACTKITEYQPDHLILIDYPGFNLRFAKYVKKHLPAVRINYYIAPKLWAWKGYRIKQVKAFVDKMYTIFPFETQYFNQRGYEVQYVGNPCVDTVSAFMAQPFDEQRFREEHNLDSRPIVALLPGSRRQEVEKCLDKMASVSEQFKEYQFVVAIAPSLDDKLYQSVLKYDVKAVQSSTYELLRAADAAIVNSGTATLETALFKVPQVVVYSVIGGRIALWLKEIIIKTKHVSLVNIIAQKEVVKELIASDFTSENVAHELDKILNNNKIKEHIELSYAQIAADLGDAGAAKRCASLIYNDKK